MNALLVREVTRRGDSKGRSWVWTAALIVGAVGSVGVLVGPRRPVVCCFCESKTDIAVATVKKYAYEAYPSWRATHEQACPRELAELNEFMNNKDTFDPWGVHYQMRCDERGIVVRSFGEDGRYDTRDDLRSDW